MGISKAKKEVSEFSKSSSRRLGSCAAASRTWPAIAVLYWRELEQPPDAGADGLGLACGSAQGPDGIHLPFTQIQKGSKKLIENTVVVAQRARDALPKGARLRRAIKNHGARAQHSVDEGGVLSAGSIQLRDSREVAAVRQYTPASKLPRGRPHRAGLVNTIQHALCSAGCCSKKYC